MVQRLKRHILLLAASLMLAVPVAMPAIAAADNNGNGCTGVSDDLATGANAALGGNDVNCNKAGVDNKSIGDIARGIVQIISIVIGVIAVIMIIFAGARYITSGGDSARTGAAKNTLIYAIIGLLIVALAQLIIHFVLHQSKCITTTNSNGDCASSGGGNGGPSAYVIRGLKNS